MTQRFPIFGPSGVLRRASNSTAVLCGLKDPIAPNAALSIFPLNLVLRPQVVIASAHDKVQAGHLVDETLRHFTFAGVDDLLDEIRAARCLGSAA